MRTTRPRRKERLDISSPVDNHQSTEVAYGYSSRKWRYSKTAHFLTTHRHSPPVSLLFRLAEALIDAKYNSKSDFARNGEAELLRRLSSRRPDVMLDVGANVGRWAQMAREFCHPSVHCFELDPQTRSQLQRNVASDAEIHVADIALDAEERTVQYYFHPSESALTSMMKLDHLAGLETRSTLVTTGDAYLRDNSISYVDLVKIDVEGSEGRILSGFGEALRSRALRVIQFEYSPALMQSGFLLRDIYKLLTGHGYIVGRLYPDGVEFKDFQLSDETFRTGNYVAVLNDDYELINILRTTSSSETTI